MISRVDQNRVFIAGPYSLGDTAMNVHIAIKCADTLMLAGYVPFIPHFTHFWHLITPKPYETWLAYDKCWLPFCNFLCRLPGDSFGADGEVQLARQLGIPVHDIQWFVDNRIIQGTQDAKR